MVRSKWAIVCLCVILLSSFYIGYEKHTSANQSQIIATGTVNVNSLNVRQTPSTSGTRVGSLTRGATVSIYETSVNGSWLKIRTNNQWAYVHGDYVNVTPVSNASSNTNNNAGSIVATGTVNVNSLNIRQSPSTTATRVGSLTRGASISIYETGISGNWLKIRVNNQWAYVHSDYITITSNNNQSSNNNSNSNNSNNSNTIIATGTVNVNSLNVRQTASTTGTRVGSLSQGATISIYERNVNGDWLKIRVNNQWAYVHGDYVTISTSSNNQNNSGSSSNNNNNNTNNSNTIIATGTVNVNSLNVRQTASTSGTRVGSLSRRATVSIFETNVNGNWLKIKLNNQWAYIHGDYVTVTVKNYSQNSSGSANSSVPANALAGKTIVIDPGHGGSDSGAVGNGLLEKDVVLRVSLALRDKLQAAGAKVVMTRTNDTFVSVNKRFEIANATNGHSFVSIHTNSLSNSTAHGTETFWNRTNQHAGSQKLAQITQKHLIQQLKTRDRGVIESNFGVVRYTKMPSILVEIGFITNPNDANMMKQDRFYNDAAEALLQALVEFHK